MHYIAVCIRIWHSRSRSSLLKLGGCGSRTCSLPSFCNHTVGISTSDQDGHVRSKLQEKKRDICKEKETNVAKDRQDRHHHRKSETEKNDEKTCTLSSFKITAT